MGQSNNKIIIVDDDEDLLRLITASFQAQGYSIITCKTQSEAQAYFEDGKNIKEVCLLILDRVLPDGDGLDILYFIRQKYGDKIPILILSALSSERDIMEGLSKGAVDYISKPFNMGILMQKAFRLLTKK